MEVPSRSVERLGVFSTSRGGAMRGRGRKPDIEGLVDRREGSEEAKRKAKVLLRTFGDELTVIEAGEILGLNEGRAHVWRERMLQGGVEALEPRAPGRPKVPVEPRDEALLRLEKENAELRRQLFLERVREELSVIRAVRSAEKKTR
jgi:hypothetical protein